MNNNFEIIKTIFENNLQKIVECRDINTGNVYINNTIINQRLIKLINIEKLKDSSFNLHDAYKTDDRLYIVTYPLNDKALKLKQYINTNKLTLKQQFAITEEILKLAVHFDDCSDLMQYKVINQDSIYITPENKVIANAYFEFYEEYDLSDNYTLKNLGNMIHYIFAGEEIIDYNISDKLPPDVLKVTVKCLTKEYKHPKDALDDLINSPIYSMINCKPDKSMVLKNMNSEPRNEASAPNEDINKNDSNTNLNVEPIILPEVNDIDGKSDIIEEEQNIEEKNLNVIDIFLNDTTDKKSNTLNGREKPRKVVKKEKKQKKQSMEVTPILEDDAVAADDEVKKSRDKSNKLKPMFIMAALIIAFGVGKFTLDKIEPNAQQIANNKTQQVANSQNNVNSQLLNNNTNDNKNMDASNGNENNQLLANTEQVGDQFYFSDYFNKDILSSIGYTGNIAVVDSTNSYDNDKSLLIENSGTENVKGLFAVIDFNSENYKYMKNKQVGVSAKFKSEKDLEAVIAIEAYKDGKIVANNSGKVQVYNDVWSMKQITINIGDIDRVQLYLEYNQPNKIWIDSIGIDVLK